MTPFALDSMIRPGDLQPGDMVGHWRVEYELGRGGMGAVYAVLHTAIGKRAAMKVIHQQALATTYDAERFLIEARAVNAVPHPNIVDIFESGTLTDGRPYLVMERLHGKTLGDRQDEGRVPALEVMDYLIPLCDALAAAHGAGIVHRDIKLDNVFLVDPNSTQLGLGGGPTVKLLDWGIASMVNRDGERSYSNLMVGTPRYVAPEQARGERVTTASDIYSLGVVAYELFLEEPPFNAPSAAELLVLHLTEPPPLPREVWPQIPPALEELLLAMLAKTPALRPSIEQVATTLIDLRNELRRAVTVPPEHAIDVPVPAPRRTPPPFERELTPNQLGHEPTQLPTEPPPAALVDPWWRSWRWASGVALIATALAFRMFLHGGPTRATADAVSATPIAETAAPPRAELGLEPALPIAPSAETGIETATAAAPVSVEPAKATLHRTVRRTAAGTPIATETAARPAPRQPTRSRLHPDAVIDPY